MDKNSSDDISFGEWVRQRRHILDLTQQELADQKWDGSKMPGILGRSSCFPFIGLLNAGLPIFSV